jgi:hypothetical protein
LRLRFLFLRARFRFVITHNALRSAKRECAPRCTHLYCVLKWSKSYEASDWYSKSKELVLIDRPPKSRHGLSQAPTKQQVKNPLRVALICKCWHTTPVYQDEFPKICHAHCVVATVRAYRSWHHLQTRISYLRNTAPSR